MTKHSFGYFDDQNREYIITKPDTPLPWINYLGIQDYFALISNTAGGYSFYQDARLRRLTRYRYNNVPTDVGGRYLYLRDDKDGDYWSPSWQPITTKDLKDYRCRHGLGYTIIESTYRDIKVETRYFVPLNETLEIWDTTVSNRSGKSQALSMFSSIEFNLWNAWDDQTNYQRNLNIGEIEIDDNTIYHKTEYRERRDHFAFFTSSEDIIGFETQREVFLGAYQGWSNPQVVVNGRTTNSIAYGWSPMGSHHIKINLEPGESKRIVFILGYHQNPTDRKFTPESNQFINKQTIQPIIDKFTKYDEVDRAYKRLLKYWDSHLQILTVNTPNEHVNRMVNIWNLYQNMATFNLSRSASYFESGIGRGMGFRDSNQDLLGFIHMVPERARERILDLAATQLENGGVYHQYQPLTKRGNDAVGSGFNDDPLWLILSVVAYIKETGDFSILTEEIPYDNTTGTESPLIDHLEQSINYTLDRLGPHGLPLIGRADWNDCLNLNCFSTSPGESFQTTTNKEGNTAESLFIAAQFVLACKEMEQLLSYCSKNGKLNVATKKHAIDYKNLADEMTMKVLDHGWDGKWFLRAYDFFGRKIGSGECDEGKIFIEPQGMSVMAGIGVEDGRAQQALNSVNQYLATDHGIVLHQPAFTQYYPHLGEISSYPPGYKENAGIFCHSNPWIMIAEAILGNGDRALDYYLRINPSKREEISSIHRTEPYVYSQMIAGIDAPTHGEAKNSWLTGTAAYNYVAITQWILGLRPNYEGLSISPIIPGSWDGFNMNRIFRGVSYEINIERVGTGNSVQLIVDGEKIEGNIIPHKERISTPRIVKVILGA